MQGYGAMFCREIEPYLDNLKTLLKEAERQGVSNFDAVRSAQAVYDDISGFVLYVSNPFSSGPGDCERHTEEVQRAITRVTIVLDAIPGANLSVPRPDAQTPSPESRSGLFPAWTKFALFGILGVMALGYLSPLLGLVPQRKLAGYRRKRRFKEYEPEDQLD